ncbi:expressed unknown protein [Seminavis robusta]|uniref:Secreted protein n=1 Tax=Seminavis robusta TaxID=568900 RepID=A0A9N8ENK7_9STRA|nr:expressed unknown protein [Seminavis robusta]|eukprot:Sro1397_g269180.1 n/a (238) ;mRNA; f:17808-18521
MKIEQSCLLLWLALAVLVSDSPVSAYLRSSASPKSLQKRRQLLVRYLKSKADRINPAFAEELSSGSATYSSTVDEQIQDEKTGSSCDVSGTVTYTISKVSSDITQGGVTTILPVPGSDDLWTLKTSFGSFSADMTAQVLGKHCGRVMDFTSFGRVTVEGAQVKATIRLNGPKNRPEVVDIVDVEQHHIEFETSSATFSKLIRRIPLQAVEQDMNQFIHSLFTSKFQSVMEGELTRSS